MAQLIRALATRHDVASIYLRARGEEPIDDDLRETLVRVEEIPYPRRLGLAARVARRTAAIRGIPAWASFVDVPALSGRLREMVTDWHPDIVHFEYHVMGQYARALPDRRAARVLSEYEAGVLAAREHIATGREGGALQARLQRRAWERFERRIIARMDAVVVFSDRDREALTPLARGKPIVRIGIGTRLPPCALDPLGAADHPRLVFVGNFMHPPNVDAALRLMDHIFPAVRARVPNAVLRIVGAHPPQELFARAGAGVDVTGRVPAVEALEVVARPAAVDRRVARLAVLHVRPLSPDETRDEELRLGGGMRVKVVEALAHGKAVVASPRAVEGLDVTDGVHVALAERDEEFVSRIVALLESPSTRASLARSAREWAIANLGDERWVAEYEALYATLRPRLTS